MNGSSGLIDCDIHQTDPRVEEWVQLLPEPYRSEVGRHGLRRVASGHRIEDGGMRWDLMGEKGGKTLSDPEFFVENLLDRYGHAFGLLSGNNGSIAGNPDPDYTAAICSAYNDYTMTKWLEADERFGMSLEIPLQDPDLAVREIERLGPHPRVKAVSMFATANRIAFGERYYWPIYEACQRHRLPIHIHPSTTAVVANAAHTPAGSAATYFEMHCCLPQFYMAQTVSLVLRGVFEKFPGLRVMLVEGGISWLPHVLWRMDAEFKGLRHETPYLKRMPSEYVRDHIRLTTQPIEDPPRREHLEQIFDMVDSDAIVMYASDFPHWDFDEPAHVRSKVRDSSLQRLFHDNACEFLELPCVAHPRVDLEVGVG